MDLVFQVGRNVQYDERILNTRAPHLGPSHSDAELHTMMAHRAASSRDMSSQDIAWCPLAHLRRACRITRERIPRLTVTYL